MTECISIWLRVTLDRCAVTALEYSLIVATIMAQFHLLANSVSTKFSTIGGSL